MSYSDSMYTSHVGSGMRVACCISHYDVVDKDEAHVVVFLLVIKVGFGE